MSSAGLRSVTCHLTDRQVCTTINLEADLTFAQEFRSHSHRVSAVLQSFRCATASPAPAKWLQLA